ncbi:MAG: hypothetical protein DWH91_17945 [Planctomycetota bacterium]|nr:MAG: hypothetical protein DWH91_17945 [Planctomycetota bacterium]
MPRHTPRDDDDDWLSDDESWRGGPLSDDDDEEFDDDHAEEVTVPCRMCGCDIYDDAIQCPLCGEYQTKSPLTAWEGRPLWWRVGGLLGIIAVLLTLIGLMGW